MKRRVTIAVMVAAALWFFMFSPWTGGVVPFWVAMSCSAVVLTTMAIVFSPAFQKKKFSLGGILSQLTLGIVIAFALWGVFWIGDKLSSLMFDFARPQVDNVYSMKDGFPPEAIALLLLFVIGPAEEFFWRGFVQRSLCELYCPDNQAATKDTGARMKSPGLWKAFIVTTVIYALIHIWSFNFMLVMAAFVAGAVWGLIYLFRPNWLPALIVSHAVWDALVFVILPI